MATEKWNTTQAPEQFYEEEEQEHVYGFSVRFDTPAVILAMLIVILNSLVLILVIRRKHLRTQANYLLCSLAVSDLLTGLVDVPLYLVCNIVRTITPCVLAENFLRMTSVSTILHLVAVSVDRFVAMKYALNYRDIVTPIRSHIIKIVIWLSAICVAFVQLVWNNPTTANLEEDGGDVKFEIPYDIGNLVLFLAIPLIIMVTLYSVLFYDYVVFIRRHPSRQRIQTSKERKTVLVFVVMFVVYCACWLPYFLVRLQHNIGDEFFVLPHILEYIFIYLRFVNAVLNPCIYVFGKSDFRKALKEMIFSKNDVATHGSSGISDVELTTVQYHSSI